jgi:hypothetical protein
MHNFAKRKGDRLQIGNKALIFLPRKSGQQTVFGEKVLQI